LLRCPQAEEQQVESGEVRSLRPVPLSVRRKPASRFRREHPGRPSGAWLFLKGYHTAELVGKACEDGEITWRSL
jgi:hypothetical protein